MIGRDDVEKRLGTLDAEIRQCNLCPERDQFPATSRTFQLGSQKNVLFIGRDPAKEGWRKSGTAFFKTDGSMLQSGKIFSNQLKEVGMEIEDITFVELIKCFPVGDKMRNPRRSEIENCRRWLDRQMGILRPKVIVPMGKECYEFFRRKRVSSLSACIERTESVSYHGIPVVPIFHPSSANQKCNWRNVVILKGIMEEFGGD
ncbi:MAG: hypothetical protein KAW39_00990 [Thermoplasmata archaeon]|nr:hypothetical protein [Thermoplasmata archaeon]